MNRLDHKKDRLAMRKKRVRANVSGTSERPRLSVFISNQHVVAQIIDDSTSKTIVHATTSGQKLAGKTLTQKAEVIGVEIAKKAKAKKISLVAFDRNGRLYHGRVKALADAARKEGLEF